MSKLFFGFSLLELLLVVGLIAILASIALPSYQTHLRKTRRMQALQTLLAIELAEEKYHGLYHQYGDLSQVAPQNELIAESHYRLKVTQLSRQGFTLIAQAQGSQARDQEQGVTCAQLSLTIKNANELKQPSACWLAA